MKYRPVPAKVRPRRDGTTAGPTRRQLIVAATRVRTGGNAETADALGISVNTVRVHIAELMYRVGAETFIETLAALGWLKVPDLSNPKGVEMADYPPRIIRIRYRSAVNGRVAVAYAKVPYSGLFDLGAKMARLMHTRQVKWFRIDEARPDEIARERATLVRWPEALSATVSKTRINMEM